MSAHGSPFASRLVVVDGPGFEDSDPFGWGYTTGEGLVIVRQSRKLTTGISLPETRKGHRSTS
jgi:hypothetical protein